LTSRLITGLAATAAVWLAGDTLMRPTSAGGVVTAGVVAVLVAVATGTVAVLVAVLVPTVAVLVAVAIATVAVLVGVDTPVIVIVPPAAEGVPMLA
jgi:hypothetical protein